MIAVADWLPDVQATGAAAFYRSCRARYPVAADDYVHMRMQLMVEALAQSVEAASRQTGIRSVDTMNFVAVGAQLERVNVAFGAQSGTMRTSDHLFQQALVVGLMDRQGTPGVQFDVEGSGYGFR